jgi:sugar phosphate isomerase/epimerase
MKKYLIATSILPNVVGQEFYDYLAIPKAFKLLDLDGIEFVFLPEWEKEFLPITANSNYLPVKNVSVDEVTTYIKESHTPVYTIQISSNVGNYLCSEEEELVLKGKDLLNENLRGAVNLNAELVVIRLWDTYLDVIDINKLFKMVFEVSKQYNLKITYENIPISDKSLSNYEVWKKLYAIMPENHGFTMDLNYCSLYDDFSKLQEFADKIYNIHVHGFIQNNVLKPRFGNIDISSCLKSMKELNYDNFVTLELTRVSSIDECRIAIALMKENI